MRIMEQYKIKDLKKYGIWQKKSFFKKQRHLELLNQTKNNLENNSNKKFMGRTIYKHRFREFYFMNQYLDLKECIKSTIKNGQFNAKILDIKKQQQRKTAGCLELSSSL